MNQKRDRSATQGCLLLRKKEPNPKPIRVGRVKPLNVIPINHHLYSAISTAASTNANAAISAGDGISRVLPRPILKLSKRPYNHQQYAYAQAPPASYYGSYPAQQNPVYQRPAPSGFFRGILTGLIVLVVLLCISTTITFVLRPQIPVFSVTSFSVSNFNLTGPVFSAQWTANLTVENPNTKLNGYFDRIKHSSTTKTRSEKTTFGDGVLPASFRGDQEISFHW
ncbi:hypothetical protein Bca52824_000364 [Brassica carinata]|uniref:Late embryogenesis abundant protein LEA-2 subgroup domain-containing protein n=1 Tax=Brassica carinata TaxID=52824 RepID=A0A8X8B8V4_BRACI|nr:hypothetical protein Bca52824_000364 [Brassica carinata]